MARYFLRHPPDPRPSLVVQTCEHVHEAIIREFKELLHGLGCSNGLLFDPSRCYVIHDTFSSLRPESLTVETTKPTDAVLGKLAHPGRPRPPQLDRRVGAWLEMLSSIGSDALSDDPEVAAPFFTDVVPAATQATISVEHSAEDAA
jgi:hypothetical protein